MLTESLLTNPRPRSWLGRSGKSPAHPASSLQTAIERQFLYRGSSTLEIKRLTLDAENRIATAEWYARLLYQTDDRLKYKPWAQLFMEQTLEDTAKVLKAVWSQLPTLEDITLRVWRQFLPPHHAAEEVIVRLHAAGEDCRQATLNWGKTNFIGLLRKCEVGYEVDPRLGLRGLTEETGQLRHAL
jgi:hypothetical protein